MSGLKTLFDMVNILMKCSETNYTEFIVMSLMPGTVDF